MSEGEKTWSTEGISTFEIEEYSLEGPISDSISTFLAT